MRSVRLGPGDFRTMPWKNGGGATTELLIEPPGATLDGFCWRLSMATVASSGPFSSFPGIDRTLLLLEGGGLELDHGPHGRVLLPGPLEPAAFAGEWPTRGRLLDGPCRDFNVMSDRARVRHRLLVLRPGPAPAALPAAPTVLAFCAGGRAALSAGPGLQLELPAGELLRLDLEPSDRPALAAALAPATALVVVTLEPR